MVAVGFQVAALGRGSFILVQSLCALSLVFALPLGARFSGQKVGRRSILGAGITVLGIILIVAIGQPQEGSYMPTTSMWLASGIVLSVLIALFYWQANMRRGAIAAVLFGMAAGLGYAYQAAVSKEFVLHLGNGLYGILTTWTTYVLLVAWLAGFILEQSALKSGFLAPGLAACNSTILVTSLILGAILFGETISKGGDRLSPALIGLALAVIGVSLLAFPESRRLEPAVQ